MLGGESRGFAGSVGLLVLVVLYGGYVIALAVRRRASRNRPPLSNPDHGAIFIGTSVAVGMFVLVAGAFGLSKAGSLSDKEAAFLCENGEIADLVLAPRGVTIIPVESGESRNFAAPVLTVAKLGNLMDRTDALVREKSRLRYRLRQMNRRLGQELADLAASKRQPATAVQGISLKSSSIRQYIVSGGVPARVIGSPAPLCISQDGNARLVRMTVPPRS